MNLCNILLSQGTIVNISYDMHQRALKERIILNDATTQSTINRARKSCVFVINKDKIKSKFNNTLYELLKLETRT